MRKYLTFVVVFLLSFLCMKGNVFAEFKYTLQSSSGKTAKYSITSSIKYTHVTVEKGEGVSSANLVWNADGVSGLLTVTFSSPDCIGDVTLKYDKTEGCSSATPSAECESIITDARSMIGKIPYEYGGKCKSTSFEECKFNTIWTDSYPHIKGINSMEPANPRNKAKNLSRHGDGKGHTGLDCSGFVWWIYKRHGIDLYPSGGVFNASVANITSGGQVISITKDQAQVCDLVSSTKPEDSKVKHIGIVSSTPASGGSWAFIHTNGTDDNVAENAYFDQAQASGKAVYYWRVPAVVSGGGPKADDTCSGAEPLHLDNSELCTCDTCDDIVIKEDYIDKGTSVINNCCLDGDSHIKEYYVSELFCKEDDENTKVKYYKNQCNNDLYEDDVFKDKNLNNDYCKMYCVEEMDLKTPKQIESATGKFFKLKELTYTDLSGASATTKAPVITGRKICTAQIAYDKWRKDYEDQIKLEVKAYNELQKNLAYYELLKDASKEEKSFSQDISLKCVSKTSAYRQKKAKISNGTSYYLSDGTVAACGSSDGCEVDVYVLKDSTYTNSSGESATCGTTTCADHESYIPEKEEKVTCNNKYYQYKIKTSGKATTISCSGGKCSIKYYQVKPNDAFTDGTSYNGLKIVSKGTETATYDEITGMPKEDACTGAVNSKISGESGGWTCTANSTPKELPDGLKKADMKAEADSYEGKANDARNNLSSYTSDATKLEDSMTKCQTMFHNTDLAAEDSAPHDSSDIFQLKPSTTFYYMQTYLNKNTKNDKWNEVPYGQAKCKYTFKNTGVEDIDGVDSYYSLSKFKDGQESMQDLKWTANMGFITAETQIPLDAADIIDKKFRQDAQYDAQCIWDDSVVDEEYTLYPGPIVVKEIADAGEKMITGHKYQYALYLTTFASEYETYWEIKDIGGSQRTKNKFIKAFNEAGNTCAQSGAAYSNGQAEKIENVEPDKEGNIKQTCVIYVQEGGMRIGTCEPGVGSADKSCDENKVQEVFEFRVVDPKVLFPSGNWNDKAHNWKKSDGQWGGTKGEIETRAQADKTYSPDNLTYSYKLDVNTLKAIKEYNKTGDRTYDDFNLKCSCPDETDLDEKGCGTIDKPVDSSCLITEGTKTKWKYTCRKCESKFLNSLSNTTKTYNDDTKKLPNAWNNKVNTYSQVRDNLNHWA